MNRIITEAFENKFDELEQKIRERDAEIAELKARLAISREMTWRQRQERLQVYLINQGWRQTPAFGAIVYEQFAPFVKSNRRIMWVTDETDPDYQDSIERAEAQWVQMYGEFQ
jgi:hypothetical protein